MKSWGWTTIYPSMLAAGLLIVSFVPISILKISMVMPWFVLMVLYFFSVFKPALFPTWVVALLGLFYDALSFYPLGLHMLLWVGLRMLLITQRKVLVQQSFWLLWAGFCVVMLIYAMMFWILVSGYQPHGISVVSMGGNVLMTITCYPLMHRLCSRLHRLYLRQHKEAV